ncbi:alpha/beta fold hydrolase [Luteolibacter ambystomatis]|uniref:Alpha/beta fold hydrolase n=1 Tax=Luteolibacter ambystomatis TaxID=2824561 RepID=A0A975G9J2_9BACT|nr:alpha/beta fold hydrolase [Luteolibacter ambystomatis]QUE51498.1 alpha/beta fold hydrolase [Luteolibacter ambystomatis]
MKGTVWCLHGAVGQAADWSGFTVPGFSIRRVDLWRFLDCCPMSMPDFGRALNEEARRVSGPNILLGYSMGGRLALHSLLADDSPWDAAIIVSAHPGLESEAERSARRESDAVWAAKALRGEWPDFLAEWNAQPVLGGANPGMADRRLLAQRRREVGRSFVDWSLGAQQSLWDRLPEIRRPVLWICGECDAKFRALAERAVPLLFQGTLEIIPDAGHRVPWENPGIFGMAVEQWLQSID